MDFSKITRIVSAVVVAFNMNASQEAKLNSYVKIYQYQWISEQKHEQEIELLIKEEAYKITR